MALKTQYLIVCDSCCATGPVYTGERTKASLAQQARRNARANGWQRCRRGDKNIDICPKCAKAVGAATATIARGKA